MEVIFHGVLNGLIFRKHFMHLGGNEALITNTSGFIDVQSSNRGLLGGARSAKHETTVEGGVQNWPQKKKKEKKKEKRKKKKEKRKKKKEKRKKKKEKRKKRGEKKKKGKQTSGDNDAYGWSS